MANIRPTTRFSRELVTALDWSCGSRLLFIRGELTLDKGEESNSALHNNPYGFQEEGDMFGGASLCQWSFLLGVCLTAAAARAGRNVCNVPPGEM